MPVKRKRRRLPLGLPRGTGPRSGGLFAPARKPAARLPPHSEQGSGAADVTEPADAVAVLPK